jgi:lysophospholipase L1-like esterase
MLPSRRRVIVWSVLVIALAAGCGTQVVPGRPVTGAPTDPAPGPVTGAPTALAPGPVTVVALGDSLTAGDGDDAGQGFVGRVTEAIAARPGREGSTLVNIGRSGWTSTDLVSGQDGSPGELGTAVDAVRTARADGAAVLATVLMGANDLWYVYEYGPEGGTPAADEDAAVAAYRANLDRTVTELQQAGAVVVVGLPDDQSIRPGFADPDRLGQILGNVTVEEVGQMSRLADRLDETAEEVATAHGALVVDTNDPFWADQSTMAEDGIHPNAAGYTELAALWMEVIEPVL